jgi:hypothetical protein
MDAKTPDVWSIITKIHILRISNIALWHLLHVIKISQSEIWIAIVYASISPSYSHIFTQAISVCFS